MSSFFIKNWSNWTIYNLKNQSHSVYFWKIFFCFWIKYIFESIGVLDPNGSSLCCFCISCAEDVSHVLLHCNFTWRIWSELVKWWSLVWVVPESVNHLLDWWSGFKFKKILKCMWEALPSAVMWFVWKARNEIKFAGSVANWCEVCDSIKLHIALLVKYHIKGVDFSVNDLLYYLESIRGFWGVCLCFSLLCFALVCVSAVSSCLRYGPLLLFVGVVGWVLNYFQEIAAHDWVALLVPT